MGGLTKLCVLAALTGCGTIINGSHATVTPPPGGFVDGSPGPVVASQQRSHEVIYPDGRRCIVESRVGAGVVIVDIIFLPLLIPIIVDAVTGNWRHLDAEGCPGVTVD